MTLLFRGGRPPRVEETNPALALGEPDHQESRLCREPNDNLSSLFERMVGAAAAAQDRTSRRRLQPLVSRRVSRYSHCMKVAIELPTGQAAQLEAEAKRLGVSVEDLARAAVTDLLAAPDAAFQASAKRILAQNLELYRRLA